MGLDFNGRGRRSFLFFFFFSLCQFRKGIVAPEELEISLDAR